jgi:hypothetical protein
MHDVGGCRVTLSPFLEGGGVLPGFTPPKISDLPIFKRPGCLIFKINRFQELCHDSHVNSEKPPVQIPPFRHGLFVPFFFPKQTTTPVLKYGHTCQQDDKIVALNGIQKEIFP